MVTSTEIQHGLQDSWTLWYDDPAHSANVKNAEWEENLKLICEFKTIEEFWGMLNILKKPSEIPNGANYSLFKTGIKPMWEEPVNKEGGKWTYTCSKARRAELDNCWLHTSLALIGNRFGNNSNISGAVVSSRKGGDRIALWTKSYSNQPETLKTGTQFKVPP